MRADKRKEKQMLKTLQIKTTKRDEMIDITREVEAFLQETGITSGANIDLLSAYDCGHYN